MNLNLCEGLPLISFTDGLSAPGRYDWDVAVPVNVMNGTYQLALRQGNASPIFSPAFTFVIPPEEADATVDAPEIDTPFTGAGATATTTTTTTVTAIYLPFPSNMTMPTVTYIYWEESCGCHQTSTCAQSEIPKSLSTTTVTYLESACGCTTTVEAPCAETVIPVALAAATPAPATNTPMAPTVAPAAPVAPTQTQSTMPAYTGAASRLAGSGLSFLAVAFAMVLA